jgi:hypothetical protein
MRRWAPPIIRIIGFLLLGAVVNVAVAWGLHKSPLGDWETTVRGPTESEFEFWFDARPAVFDQIPEAVVVRVRPGAETCALLGNKHGYVHLGRDGLQDYASTNDPWEVHLQIRQGWPALCVTGELWSRGQPPASPVANSGLLRGTLPYIPIWPGFAINTVFYAGLLWLHCAAPFALRRSRRVRKGLCAKCAYPVGGSEVCTECGQPVTPRSGGADSPSGA